MTLLSCGPKQLMCALRSAAIIEAMMTDEDWLRRFHFTENWKIGIDMANFSNGSGDDMYILSGNSGVIIKGFDHESDVSPYMRDDHSPWPGMYDGVPDDLMRYMDDASICNQDVTFLHWFSFDSNEWRRGPVEFPNGITDGSEWMIPLIPLTAEDYIRDAANYFEGVEQKVQISVIRKYFG